ncbi:MAG: peptidoglycan DD-metalloendopeptidase family protein [Candidatus Pacebacteria bacterium]|nr:peptidoglycan DD-metalloendopeptidase family protein [Candidatus Paceibacterota bacterium]
MALFGFTPRSASMAREYNVQNSQNLALLGTAEFYAMSPATGGSTVAVDNHALVPTMSPAGALSDQVFTPGADQVSLYVVQNGDTLNQIAQLFGVSVNTIRWANDLGTRGTIRPGQILTILPITSVRHTVKKGDTLASLTKKYGGDITETAVFNGLEVDAVLEPGQIILIPDGIMAEAAPTPPPASRPAPAQSSRAANTRQSTPQTTTTRNTPQPPLSATQDSGAFFRRAWGGVVSQGYHGPWRAVDYAMPIGSPIGAAGAGTVIAARSPSAWNGGYGGLIILQHPNGAQTYYAHLDQLKVSVGQQVEQGQLIGLSGNTGRSTGPHLHFEIRNWGDIPMNW